jgi:hypothetical protein
MTDADKPAFTSSLILLAEALGEEVSRARLEAYWTALKGFELGRIRDAVDGAIKSCKRFPPPAVLIELIPPAPTREHRVLPPAVDWEDNQRRVRELIATLETKMTGRA